jgi:hypothetical protein
MSSTCASLSVCTAQCNLASKDMFIAGLFIEVHLAASQGKTEHLSTQVGKLEEINFMRSIRSANTLFLLKVLVSSTTQVVRVIEYFLG